MPVFARVCTAFSLIMIAVVAPAHAAACSAPDHEGGEWPVYGHDAQNTRHQPLSELTPDRAAALVPAWTFSSTAAGADGDFTGTAVTAGGCVFVGSNTGWVFAIDAETGDLAWKTLLDAPAEGFLAGGGIPGSLAVADGVVYVNASRQPGPFLAALDQSTGVLLWETTVATKSGHTLSSSPAVFDDLIFVGVSAPSGGDSGRIVLVNTDGTIASDTTTIPEDLWDDGFQGAGVWSTPGIDEEAKIAYVGTGEPDAGGGEVQAHAHTNAVVAVDLDRESPTFGEIIGSFQGTSDGIDFGASPVVFEDDEGATLVGALQRNGPFHAIDPITMTAAWSATLGPSGPHRGLGDAGSPSTDGESIFLSTNPGIAFSLDGDDGAIQWAALTADAARYHPMASGGGVVYTLDAKGFLLAFESSTGALLAARPLSGPETGLNPTVNLASGVTVARDMVFATVGTSLTTEGFVVAFRSAI